MRSSSPLRVLFAAFSAFTMLAVAGCGGSDKSCSDACNNLFSCAGKLDFTPSTYLGSDYATVSACVDRCTTGDCPRKQDLINCGADVQCNDLNQVQTDFAACFTNAGCTP